MKLIHKVHDETHEILCNARAALDAGEITQEQYKDDEMNALQLVINEMTDSSWNEYDDSETIWGKPSNTLTFGDFRRAAAELAALQADLTDRTEQNIIYKKNLEILHKEFERSQSNLIAVEANYDALQTPMPCGHLARYAVSGEEGTQYCAMCVLEEKG